jgi:hypothetical protein
MDVNIPLFTPRLSLSRIVLSAVDSRPSHAALRDWKLIQTGNCYFLRLHNFE